MVWKQMMCGIEECSVEGNGVEVHILKAQSEEENYVEAGGVVHILWNR